MTDGIRLRPQASVRPAPAPGAGPLPTVLAALAIFAVAFEFLAFHLSAGGPALGGARPRWPPRWSRGPRTRNRDHEGDPRGAAGARPHDLPDSSPRGRAIPTRGHLIVMSVHDLTLTSPDPPLPPLHPARAVTPAPRGSSARAPLVRPYSPPIRAAVYPAE